MTREEKELVLIDLCARLPYGVRGRDRYFDFENDTAVIVGITQCEDGDYKVCYEDGNYSLINEDCSFKPVLFPLSAIKESIEFDGEKVNISEIINSHFFHCFYIDKDGDIDISSDEASFVCLDEYRFIIDTFNRYHIDYRGLIDKGLAVSVYDLEENPYK